MEYMALYLFLTVCLVLLIGFPVAFSLAGTALAFAGIGMLAGHFDASFLHAVPNRLFGIISNTTLMAVPLFIFMGVMLEKSKVAENLLDAMALVMGKTKAGMGIAVTLVGMLLAASTGIVGATVVTMGLLALPTMLKRGYSPQYSAGIIAATGSLGQIIPPSIALVLLGDVLSSSYQQAQLNMGIFSPETISIADLFAGAVIPGIILVVLYILYSVLLAFIKPEQVPSLLDEDIDYIKSRKSVGVFSALVPPLLLIICVLGSILFGLATPTEASGVGAFGASLLALWQKQLTVINLQDVMRQTLKITAMVFMILIGASIFSLVFRGFGGEELIAGFFEQLPGGKVAAVLVVMLVMFLLGFILDFIEITFVVVPIVAPILLMMGVDPVWLGIMIAVNLQTSFLTPPFGFALFYLRGVADKSILTSDIYKGVIPFIVMQLLLLILMSVYPQVVTWLPDMLYK
ncbi:TRAP transporter large permease [Pseudoalteromonas denitrificans]|uniref:TRAP transporter large permease protein n=1 Tax=Pseudoalteromonas denitrificans DSM 6059 TaxID=1123010 RepID=A0A1I1IHC1_9GAMM|nr:TRAP transporter large permease subunit [Pseudoalteromonas denitrificans]SFC35657.1 TRAP transporter, DctM subunit [Pseudoalteromonas denitrificans DSM 6059]